jgi:hypothetical protein
MSLVDPSLLQERKGKPKLLAKLWGIPVERIERYLVNWGYEDNPENDGMYRHKLSGRAHPDDGYEYGDYHQFFDVLKALGGEEPVKGHTLKLPRNRRK